MKHFWRAVKAGVKGAKAAYEPARFDVAGKPVVCRHCDGQEFVDGKVLLNTTSMSVVGFDWADKKATTLVCTECGCIQWFVSAHRNRPTGTTGGEVPSA